jgi:WD40 repeat protein
MIHERSLTVYLAAGQNYTVTDVTWNQKDPGRVAVSTTTGTVAVFSCDLSGSAISAQAISTPPQSLTSSYSPNQSHSYMKALSASPNASSILSSNMAGGASQQLSRSQSYASLAASLTGTIPSSSSITRKQDWDSGESVARAVHRLSWCSNDRHLLATACQDGHVRVFDTRTPKASSVDFTHRSIDTVRDVQFDPFASHNYVSSIAENGTYCLWDCRYPGDAVLKFLAHGSGGGGFSLSYHPTLSGYVAIGFRDKLCKIWNINTLLKSGSGEPTPSSSIIKPIHTIRTLASVGRIRWRGLPECPDELATSGPDRGEICVWSLSRPLIPGCVVRGHAETCSDFDWLDTPYVSPIGTPNMTDDKYSDRGDSPSSPSRVRYRHT